MQYSGVDYCTRKVMVNRMSGRSTKSPMSLIDRKLLIRILFVPDSCSPRRIRSVTSQTLYAVWNSMVLDNVRRKVRLEGSTEEEMMSYCEAIRCVPIPFSSVIAGMSPPLDVARSPVGRVSGLYDKTLPPDSCFVPAN